MVLRYHSGVDDQVLKGVVVEGVLCSIVSLAYWFYLFLLIKHKHIIYYTNIPIPIYNTYIVGEECIKLSGGREATDLRTLYNMVEFISYRRFD